MSTVRTHVTKRALGESYITATGLLLGLVLIGKIVMEGSATLLWGLVGLAPVVVLVASVYWIEQLGFGGEQVWTVAVYSAAALGAGAGIVALLDTGVFAFSTTETFLLVTSLGTVTVAGALGGVARELRRSNERIGLRNEVLHRVLRHNLRNDMSVVLCLLDDLEADADPEEREQLARARQKIESLVDLTDKVRQVNVTVNEHGPPAEPVDLAEIVAGRVERLASEYAVDIETDLPEQALVRANGEFGLVLDNVVQSAVDGPDEPELCVSLVTSTDTVALRIEDRNWSLPDADLAAVTNGAETDLEHGLGVELWLVYWLVDANDGHIDVETVDGARRIDITLDRAADRWVPASPL